jgi:putative transposase
MQLQGFERRRRDLPHWEEPGSVYAVRFSLRRDCDVGLTRPAAAPLIVGALAFHAGLRYELYDYAVMPDHVHAIMKPVVRGGTAEHLWCLTRDLKRWTARRINELLGRRGPLWRDETYDRIIRNQAEYAEWARYIYHNSVAAGLVTDPADRPWWGCGCGDGEGAPAADRGPGPAPGE